MVFILYFDSRIYEFNVKKKDFGILIFFLWIKIFMILRILFILG